jgi:hypothetical protein
MMAIANVLTTRTVKTLNNFDTYSPYLRSERNSIIHKLGDIVNEFGDRMRDLDKEL